VIQNEVVLLFPELHRVTKEFLSGERFLFAKNCEITEWIGLQVIVLVLSITTNTN